MRTAEAILNEFDNPEPGVTTCDSGAQSVRERLNVEVLLDMRELQVEIKDAIDECKVELVEIKNNTAS